MTLRHQRDQPHVERANELLERLITWIEPRRDVRALVLVGSYARGDARPDSDVDAALLVSDPDRYLHDTSWVADFGAARSVDIEPYGKVTSVRTTYEDGLEVEFTVAAEDWASPPFDPGTEEVARHGILVLMDRDGHATALARAVGPSNPRLQQSALGRAAEPPAPRTTRDRR